MTAEISPTAVKVPAEKWDEFISKYPQYRDIVASSQRHMEEVMEECGYRGQVIENQRHRMLVYTANGTYFMHCFCPHILEQALELYTIELLSVALHTLGVHLSANYANTQYDASKEDISKEVAVLMTALGMQRYTSWAVLEGQEPVRSVVNGMMLNPDFGLAASFTSDILRDFDLRPYEFGEEVAKWTTALIPQFVLRLGLNKLNESLH